MPFVEQYGDRIFYQSLAAQPERGSAGDSSRAPVILHHGMAQWGDDWLAAGWVDAFGSRAVYAVDALGHGRSDRPDSRSAYSIERRAETVLRIADDAGLDRFSFFGFSMGGRVGFQLAATHPDRLEQVVVGGMHGLKPAIDQKNLERRIAVLRSSKWRLVERAVGARREDGRNNDPEALALSTEAVLDWNGAGDELSSLKLPLLVFCGRQDSLLEYAQQTAELISVCRFMVIENAGHAASFYSSQQAKDAVQEFLS